jgi:hypothetical protein
MSFEIIIVIFSCPCLVSIDSVHNIALPFLSGSPNHYEATVPAVGLSPLYSCDCGLCRKSGECYFLH